MCIYHIPNLCRNKLSSAILSLVRCFSFFLFYVYLLYTYRTPLICTWSLIMCPEEKCSRIWERSVDSGESLALFFARRFSAACFLFVVKMSTLSTSFWVLLRSIPNPEDSCTCYSKSGRLILTFFLQWTPLQILCSSNCASFRVPSLPGYYLQGS